GRFYAFTEVTDKVTTAGLWDETVPLSLQKMKTYKISNPVIEVDLSSAEVAYNDFDQVAFLRRRLEWVQDNLGPDSRVCLNMRDFFPTMERYPERVETFVRGMAAMPSHLRPWAMNTEDPSGSYLPQTLAQFIAKYRSWWGPVSEDGVAGGGNLCIHLHKGFGLAEASVLAALGAGANGIWCGIAEVGAAVGHACSAQTITNMARYGNPCEGYNVGALRNAAVEITKITTGEEPHPLTELYGSRANQWVFDFPGMGDDFLGRRWNFNTAAFLVAKKEARVHTLSTNDQIKKRLIETWGDHGWDLDVISKMRNVMLNDLRGNVKVQYQTADSIVQLYLRAGGKIPEGVINQIREKDTRHEEYPLVIQQVRQQWEATGLTHKSSAHGCVVDCIDFRGFYDLFFARTMGCYSCQYAGVAWAFFDANDDGNLEWVEFLSWLHWCIAEFPEESTSIEGLIDTLFARIVMPDVRRALLAKCSGCKLWMGQCRCTEPEDIYSQYKLMSDYADNHDIVYSPLEGSSREFLYDGPGYGEENPLRNFLE
ncbi:hypothetical protein CYMTET_27950, partial [Cymbomonas tetramitiformis]